MFASVSLNRFFDFIPSLNFGKLWSFLKVNAPVRPIPREWRAKPIALITHFEGDIEGWAGIVFSTQNGQRLMYMPFRPDGKTLIDEARYLTVDPMYYLETATRLKHSSEKGQPNFAGLYSDIRYVEGDLVNPKDRAWLKYCLDPGKGSAPTEDITLG